MRHNARKPLNILVVDDEEGVRWALEEVLEDTHHVQCVSGGGEALEAVSKSDYDLVFLDISMPDMNGLDVLRKIRELDEEIEVVIVSAVDKAREAAVAMKLGAMDYVIKPFETSAILDLAGRVESKKEFENHQTGDRNEGGPRESSGVVYSSRSMRKVLTMVSKISDTMCDVLITGETGTGKELIARLIHESSSRRENNFIAVNCAALPDTLLESELFGHERGAFTGADRRREGCFIQADKGTIFLDEIGEVSAATQVKLLRVLQEREVRMLGGDKSRKLSIRVIAATNKTLREEVRKGNFREDLYYRLNVIPIHLPPVRERPGDVRLLVKHYLHHFSHLHHKSPGGVSESAMSVLESYPWPGNVREIKNFVERVVLLNSPGKTIEEEDIPFQLFFNDGNMIETSAAETINDGLLAARDEFERVYIKKALRLCGWNQTEAAKRIGIHRNTLIKKMNALNIKQD